MPLGFSPFSHRRDDEAVGAWAKRQNASVTPLRSDARVERLTNKSRFAALFLDEGGEVGAIGVPVLDGTTRYAAFHRGTRHGGGDFNNEPLVDGLRDEIVGAEGQFLQSVGLGHIGGDGLLGEGGDGAHGTLFHLLVDGGGGHVERTAEDVGEADHVVDLVGIVGAAGAHEHFGAGGFGLLVGDFGHWVGESEDDGALGHAAHHVGTHDVAFRQADEDIGAAHGLFERVDVGALSGKLTLLGVDVGARLGDDAARVEHDEVFAARAKGEVEAGAGNGGRTGTVDDDAHVFDALAHHLEGVEQTGAGDDGGAVLVVVHDGDVELGFQTRLDFEALGGFDVFEIDAAEGGGDGFDDLNEAFGVFLVDLDVVGVDATVDFEEEAFAFHDGFAGQGADVAETEHGGAVGDDGHEVALVGVAIGVLGLLFDFEAGLSHAGAVGEGEVVGGGVGLGGNDGNLAGTALFVVVEGFLFADLCHNVYGGLSGRGAPLAAL